MLRGSVALAATGAAVYGVVAASTASAQTGGSVQAAGAAVSAAPHASLSGSASDLTRMGLTADAISLPGRPALTIAQPAAQTAAIEKASAARATAAKAAADKAAADKAAADKAAADKAAAAKAAAEKAAAAKTAAAKAAAKKKAAAVSCSTASGLLPANVSAIVTFLVHHGYSENAAAGIAGNMYQESKGNPESAGMGGGGLIGFTPLPSGYQTGNVAADLQTQLNAVLSFNQQWSSYLPELNDASSPAAAARIYVDDFERAGIPAASTREASAEAVASACGL